MTRTVGSATSRPRTNAKLVELPDFFSAPRAMFAARFAMSTPFVDCQWQSPRCVHVLAPEVEVSPEPLFAETGETRFNVEILGVAVGHLDEESLGGDRIAGAIV